MPRPELMGGLREQGKPCRVTGGRDTEGRCHSITEDGRSPREGEGSPPLRPRTPREYVLRVRVWVLLSPAHGPKPSSSPTARGPRGLTANVPKGRLTPGGKRRGEGKRMRSQEGGTGEEGAVGLEVRPGSQPPECEHEDHAAPQAAGRENCRGGREGRTFPKQRPHRRLRAAPRRSLPR